MRLALAPPFRHGLAMERGQALGFHFLGLESCVPRQQFDIDRLLALWDGFPKGTVHGRCQSDARPRRLMSLTN